MSNCCPVIDIRGKALTAAVESLSAVGPLDEKLTDTPESSFLPEFTRTAPNAIFQRETQFGQPTTQYFGSTVKHTFKTQEMGDLLGNMYLKTSLPVLSESGGGSNVNIAFPAEFCSTIPSGAQFEISESELKRIEIGGATSLKPYLTTGTQFNNDTTIENGSNAVTNVAVGFISFDNMVLGNKLINQRIYTSNTTDFEISANVYTTETVQANAGTVDGGLRNFELKGLNRNTKETQLFNPAQDGTISISNMNLFNLGDVDVNLTATGNYSATTTTNVYAISPLISTVAPKNCKQIHFLKCQHKV